MASCRPRGSDPRFGKRSRPKACTSEWSPLRVSTTRPRWPPAAGSCRRRAATATPFGISSEGLLNTGDALEAGARFSELILVTAGADEPIVVLEGHVRLTAYLLRPHAIRDEVEALLGTSAAMSLWGLY